MLKEFRDLKGVISIDFVEKGATVNTSYFQLTNNVENINRINKGRDLLTSHRLFHEEEKGCRKGSRGTAELLYRDQHIFNESKTRQKNLDMAWIDYKKTYDMVPQSWTINCLKMYKISDEVIKFIEKCHENLESGIDSWRKKLN